MTGVMSRAGCDGDDVENRFCRLERKEDVGRLLDLLMEYVDFPEQDG